MLTEEERSFIAYWEKNRLKRKKVIKQLALGLPLATAIIVAIFVNFFSGWYQKADIQIRRYPSSIIVVIVAAILIVIFIAVFSTKHNWEQHEQRYKELLSRKDNF